MKTLKFEFQNTKLWCCKW